MQNEFSVFQNIHDGFLRSKQVRAFNRESILKFGVRYLDDALGGILKTDVIIVTGLSGGGKSELVTHIAMVNALSGKNVYKFSLEAERDEDSTRIGFKLLAQRFYQDRIFSEEKPNYLEWILGRQDHLFSKYEGEVAEELKALKNLKVIYRDESFSIEDFEKCLMSAKHDADLIILDHLHFLDFDDENENRAYKKIVKQIRHLGLVYEKPIILVAHIRKRDRRYSPIVPDVEDIHGSSDIFKAATRAIAIAPAFDQVLSEGNSYRFPTYIKTGKVRQDGSRSRYCGLVVFNARENAYEENYKIGTISSDGREWTECNQDNRPFWAKGAKNG